MTKRNDINREEIFMGKTEELVKDMRFIIVVYGILLQILCVVVADNLIKATIGLWIGIITAILMLNSMRDSSIEALDLGEAGAKKYAQSAYMKRYFTVVIVFFIVAYSGIANILTLLAGVMGLKISAYLQPIKKNLKKQN